MSAAPIYLDYHAAAPVDPLAFEAMRPYFTERFGDPGQTLHAHGWTADEAIDVARGQLGLLLNAEAAGFVFTSGATEAVNLAMRGLASTYGHRRTRIVTVATEHPRVLETAAGLERDGFEIVIVPVDRDGRVDLNALRAAMNRDTLLVAAMWANDQTGVLHPMADIAEIAHADGAFLLADATWAVGKVPVDVDAADVDLLAFDANQFYGPKGTGALWVRRRPRRVRLLAELTGAGQQDGLRSGHYNVPGIVGMGKAADLADERLFEERAYLERLRDRFEAAVTTSFADVTVNGAESPRLPTVSNLTIPGTETRKLLPLLRGIAASTGAACKTRASQPSHVLTAMGRSRADAFASLRFSFGRYTTEAEVDAAAEALIDAVGSLRGRAMAA
ncbi:MAG: cysteine desulfurase family protein [Bacteroidota bacterium]